MSFARLETSYISGFNQIIGSKGKGQMVYYYRRSSDMVARYAGDEFVAILPETGKEEAMETADMLQQKIEALHVPHAHSKVSDYVTVTIGVTSLKPDKNRLMKICSRSQTKLCMRQSFMVGIKLSF